MKEKVYLERNPRVGDIVEAVSNPFSSGDHIVGYEYQVKSLKNGYILATGERLPAGKDYILIGDEFYQVIEYREVEKPKEVHVKKYRFLGIPFGSRTTYIYD